MTAIITGSPLPVIAGVEIPMDAEGRYNLNALHKAWCRSQGVNTKKGKHKAPNKWLETKQAQELIDEINSQTPNPGSAQNTINSQAGDSQSALKVVNGGRNPGTFAHELLVISYGGWISPRFQLQVNQCFIDFKTGRLQPEQSLLEQMHDLARREDRSRRKASVDARGLNHRAKVAGLLYVGNQIPAEIVSDFKNCLGVGEATDNDFNDAEDVNGEPLYQSCTIDKKLTTGLKTASWGNQDSICVKAMVVYSTDLENQKAVAAIKKGVNKALRSLR